MKITLTLLLLALPLLAQTRTEFRQKYESPKADTYQVRRGIIMSVKFAAAPLWKNYACEAIVKPENTTASKPDVPEVMAAESVEQIIDEVIPVEERGRLVNQMSVNGGCTGLRISIYENVTISRATRCKQRGGGTYQAWIRWKAIWCEDNK
jgi:hypothetical protein